LASDKYLTNCKVNDNIISRLYNDIINIIRTQNCKISDAIISRFQVRGSALFVLLKKEESFLADY
jgi:hypothetical protein